MQFEFMPGNDAVHMFIFGKFQLKCFAKRRNLYMCFMDMEKAFDRVPRKLLIVNDLMTEISEVLVNTVMIVYEKAKRRVGFDFE